MSRRGHSVDCSCSCIHHAHAKPHAFIPSFLSAVARDRYTLLRQRLLSFVLVSLFLTHIRRTLSSLFRTAVARDRYTLLRQRLLRDENFRPTAGVSGASTAAALQHEIVRIESLIGRGGVRLIYGLLTQLEEGRYYIEDPNATVPIDLSQVRLINFEGVKIISCLAFV
jgi:hypothetical protein